MGKRGKFDIKNWANVILFILFAFAFLATVNLVNNSNKWNSLFIQISLGLLGFVAIFYSFVLRKDIKEKRETILITEWKKHLPEFNKTLKTLSIESSKEIPAYEKMLSKSKILSDKLEEITSFAKEIDINSQLYYSVTPFISVIILVIFDSIWNKSTLILGSMIYARGVAYFLLWIGFYKTIQLVLSWDKITKS